MFPIQLTEFTKNKKTNEINERLIGLNPNNICSVSEDVIKPFDEQKHDGAIPIITGKGDTQKEISARKVVTTIGQAFAVKESLSEVMRRWQEGLTGPVVRSVPAHASELQERKTFEAEALEPPIA